MWLPWATPIQFVPVSGVLYFVIFCCSARPNLPFGVFLSLLCLVIFRPINPIYSILLFVYLMTLKINNSIFVMIVVFYAIYLKLVFRKWTQELKWQK